MLLYLNVLDPFPASESASSVRSGQSISTVAEASRYSGPSLSPEGARLAVALSQPSSPARDIWVFDLIGGNRTRLTLDPHDDLAPRWSADGRWLMFTSDRRGERNIYKRLASGEGIGGSTSSSLRCPSPWTIGRLMDALSCTTRARSTGLPLPDLHLVPLSGERRQHVIAARSRAPTPGCHLPGRPV